MISAIIEPLLVESMVIIFYVFFLMRYAVTINFGIFFQLGENKR